MKKIFLIFLFCFFVTRIKPEVETITVSKGLSNRDVSCMLQTADGYMWFGTVNGLNRYDGYSIKQYHGSYAYKKGLSNGKINCLLEDEKGLLWIGTEDGLNILDQKTGTFHTFFGLDSAQKIDNAKVTSIAQLYDGSILVGVISEGLLRFTDEHTYKKIFEPEYDDHKYRLGISHIIVNEDSTAWFVVNKSRIYQLNPNGAIDTLAIGKWGESIIDIVPIGRSKLLIHKYNGLYKLDSEANITEDSLLHLINSKYKMPTTAMAEGNILWIGYNKDEFIHVDLTSGEIRNFSSYIQPYITGAPRTLMKDKTGVLWIGTNYGIIKYFPPPADGLFENYLSVHTNENIEKKHSIRGMIEDEKGDIYIGGYSGLFRFDPVKRTFKRFNLIDYKNILRKEYYPFNLLNDTAGYIWIASEGFGFYRFNKKSEQFEFPVHKDDYLQINKSSYDLAEDSGIIWLGTTRGLLNFNKSTGELKNYEPENNLYNIKDLSIIDILINKKGEVWLGSQSSGVFKLDKNKKNVIAHYGVNTPIPISHNAITCLHESDDGTLWIGTRGGGLNKFDPLNRKTKSYSGKNGLPDDIIAGIVESDGVLWISTFNGLSKFDIANETFDNYFEKDGLTDNEFNIAAHLKTKDGKIFLGGLNGINAFFPSQLNKRIREKPVLLLTQILKHDGESGEIKEFEYGLSELKEITLSYQDKFIAFYFALADYYNPSANTFMYQLEGYDKEWNNLNNQNSIRFNNLSPGKYFLKIKAMNNEGLHSANELGVKISVSQPIYTSTWFIFLLLILITGMVYMIVQYRIRQQLKLQHLRTKVSSDLHDEVGSILTGISVQTELMQKDIFKPEESKEELKKIAQKSRLATSTMNDVLWSIDARNDKMSNLIDHMREHVSEMFTPLNIYSEFVIENLSLDKYIDPDIRQNIFLIFKEAINNITKHSNATKVFIKLGNFNKDFIMTIEDNGTIPFIKNEYSGQGLKNMKMRARFIKADITIKNDMGYSITLKRKSFC